MLMKFLTSVSGARWVIPSVVKDKLLHLSPPTTKKEAQYLVIFFSFDFGGNI